MPSYTFGNVEPRSESVPTLISGKYNMDKKPHGIALIINNQNFKTLQSREGSDNDAKDLETLFCHLGYYAEVHTNLTSAEMKKLFKDIGSKRDHSSYDSFVCCILSYGDDGNKITGADDEAVELRTLTDSINGQICPSLAGKPKMFFIEASRGTKDVPPGVQLADAEPVIVRRIPYYVPDTADFLLGYATRDGYQAYRRVGSTTDRTGAYYIMEICHVFTEYASFTPLIDMMYLVHENVGTKYRSSAGVPLEAPEMTSRLRKNVFF